MSIYQLKTGNLSFINEKKIDLEKDIQLLTEKNLDTIFHLTFVSGQSNQEFSVQVNEQDFYIDTLAFDEEQKCFIIIEYKKDKSISVIDQGFAYLSAMLRNKAGFVLEINHRLGRSYQITDINWDQSKVIFVSPEFTNYQKNAVNFRDLPISLYEVKLYENDMVDYSPIKAYKTSESINKLVKDSTIQQVSKEIIVYEEDDLVKENWIDTKRLLDEFQTELLENIPETTIKYTKKYIAYMSKHGKNFVEIVPQAQSLKIYFRFHIEDIKTQLELKDCSKMGHWTNGNSFYFLDNPQDFPEIIRLANVSYEYIHRTK